MKRTMKRIIGGDLTPKEIEEKVLNHKFAQEYYVKYNGWPWQADYKTHTNPLFNTVIPDSWISTNRTILQNDEDLMVNYSPTTYNTQIKDIFENLYKPVLHTNDDFNDYAELIYQCLKKRKFIIDLYKKPAHLKSNKDCYDEIKNSIIYFNHFQTEDELSFNSQIIHYDNNTLIEILENINSIEDLNLNNNSTENQESILQKIYNNKNNQKKKYKSFISYEDCNSEVERSPIMIYDDYFKEDKHIKQLRQDKYVYRFTIDDELIGKNQEFKENLYNILSIITKSIEYKYGFEINSITNKTKAYVHFQFLLGLINNIFLLLSSKRCISGKHGLLRTLKKLVNCVRAEQIYSKKEINAPEKNEPVEDEPVENDDDANYFVPGSNEESSPYMTIEAGRKQTRRRKKSMNSPLKRRKTKKYKKMTSR